MVTAWWRRGTEAWRRRATADEPVAAALAAHVAMDRPVSVRVLRTGGEAVGSTLPYRVALRGPPRMGGWEGAPRARASPRGKQHFHLKVLFSLVEL